MWLLMGFKKSITAIALLSHQPSFCQALLTIIWISYFKQHFLYFVEQNLITKLIVVLDCSQW